MRSLSRFIGDERGITSVLVAAALLGLVGLAALAVDLGHMQFRRSAMQNAADAGALAGADALLSFGDRHADAAATAVAFARRNLRDQDDPAAAVVSADVRFLKDGVAVSEGADTVEVSVHRVHERGNPVELFFARVFHMNGTDISVASRARIVEIGSSKCVKPFSVPTKYTWDDEAEPVGSPFRSNGQLDTASAAELATVQVTGYDESDIGTVILLKPGDPSDAIVPGQYNLIDLPPVNKGTPVTGASMVNENIVGCTGSNSYAAVAPGDELLLEPGNSKGPVTKGVSDVIGLDPYAYWDASTNSIQGSFHPDPMDSPRVAIVPFYDPRQPPVSGRNTVFAGQLAAVFLESVSGDGTVQARFIHAMAHSPEGGSSGLLRTTRLVRVQ